MGCGVLDNDTKGNIIHTITIITRANGAEIAELGAGGGKGDLDQKEELEPGSIADMGKLLGLCTASIQDKPLLAKVLDLLHQTLGQEGKLDLSTNLQQQTENAEETVSLQNLTSALSSHTANNPPTECPHNRTIRFPYSHHSSYSELRGLIDALKPKDIISCNVDINTWTSELSMQNLFGDLCSSQHFRHGVEMMGLYEARVAAERMGKRARQQSQMDTQTTEEEEVVASPLAREQGIRDEACVEDETSETGASIAKDATKPEAVDVDPEPGKLPLSTIPPKLPLPSVTMPRSTKHTAPFDPGPPLTSRVCQPSPTPITAPSSSSSSSSSSSLSSSSSSSSSSTHDVHGRSTKRRKLTNRQLAYQAAIGDYGFSWSDYRGLVSTRLRKKSEKDEEMEP